MEASNNFYIVKTRKSKSSKSKTNESMINKSKTKEVEIRNKEFIQPRQTI